MCSRPCFMCKLRLREGGKVGENCPRVRSYEEERIEDDAAHDQSRLRFRRVEVERCLRTSLV